MYSLLAYIKFLLNSTNQHGVHSPFVYAYVTQCLYSKTKQSKSRTTNILLKSIAYFKVKNVSIAATDTKLKTVISHKYPTIKLKATPIDIIYLEELTTNTLNLDNIHNNSMVLVNKIHHSSQNNRQWQKIKEMDQVTVTIDMFFCGAIFFRKEQEKEHFTIRV